MLNAFVRLVFVAIGLMCIIAGAWAGDNRLMVTAVAATVVWMIRFVFHKEVRHFEDVASFGEQFLHELTVVNSLAITAISFAILKQLAGEKLKAGLLLFDFVMLIGAIAVIFLTLFKWSRQIITDHEDNILALWDEDDEDQV